MASNGLAGPPKTFIGIVNYEGAEVIVRFNETDQTAPAGRWDIDLNGDVLKIRRGTGSASAPWSSSEDWITLDKGTGLITLGKPITSPVLTTPQINDTSADHQYVFAVSELAADRTVTLPLLAANDTFVFAAHSQALSNKTYEGVTITAAAGTTLTLPVGKTVLITGNNPQNLTLRMTADTDVTLPTTGTLATLAGSESLSNKTLPSPAITGIVRDNTNAQRYVIRKTGFADNVAAGVFRVATTNEAGGNDAGSYSVFVRAAIIYADDSNVNNAVKAYSGAVAVSTNVSTGVNIASAVLDPQLSGVATQDAAVRDIGTVTMTAAVGTAYQVDITFQIDFSGTSGGTCSGIFEIVLLWAGYATAPVITAL